MTSTSVILISFLLCRFHSLRGHGTENYWVDGEENHIPSIAKNSKMGEETGLAFKWLVPIPIFHSSRHSNGWCRVVMVIEYFKYRLWVQTHLQEIKLALFHCQSTCWSPNCGSRFSFIGLVIFVGTPTDSGRTLAIVSIVGVGSSFLRYWPRNCYVLSTLLDPRATLRSHKCTTLLPLISIFSHVFKVEIWKALYKCYAEIILNWKIIMAF